jgi:hypothetical protein
MPIKSFLGTLLVYNSINIPFAGHSLEAKNLVCVSKREGHGKSQLPYPSFLNLGISGSISGRHCWAVSLFIRSGVGARDTSCLRLCITNPGS